MASMAFWRIRCHFCGLRQPHSKSVTRFQCSTCEAVNFFDGKGNVVDSPAALTDPTADAPADMPSLSFTRPPPESLAHQQTQPFCRTCTQNQLLYTETLANYLPDESHAQYKQFEAALPDFQKDLEKRYPLVCKRCAPAAQHKINRADTYGLKQNVRKLQSDTIARRGMPATRLRDDRGKWIMRRIFDLITYVLYLGLAIQITYHASGMFNVYFAAPAPLEPELSDASIPRQNSSPVVHAQRSMLFLLNPQWHHILSNFVPVTLALSAFFLWYNPGMRSWYHHTERIQAVHGQKNYFFLQAIVLSVRSLAWYNLANQHIGFKDYKNRLIPLDALTYSFPNQRTTLKFDKDQMVALHGLAIVFILITQAMANRSIKPVKWTMNTKVMPEPGDMDILGEFAGPSPDHYTPKASEHDPWKYLRRSDNSPFDINLLAPKVPTQPSFTRTPHFAQQPSPEISEEETDYDAMETDDRPVMRSSQRLSSSNLKRRNNIPGIGFGGMTDQVFGMQTKMRQEEERKRKEQEQKLRFEPPTKERSPFYGRLPPAPMSMERRLRNPVITPVAPQRLPLSQQKDFMAQMRAGVKPVQFPEKGTNFELRKSDWHLPGDVQDTGLEDQFLKTFSLADPTPPGQESKRGFFGFLGR